MHAYEILPLLLCTDAFFLKLLGAATGRLVRRVNRPSHALVFPARRPAYNPAERFLPCHRLAISISRR